MSAKCTEADSIFKANFLVFTIRVVATSCWSLSLLQLPLEFGGPAHRSEDFLWWGLTRGEVVQHTSGGESTVKLKHDEGSRLRHETLRRRKDREGED